LVGLVLFLLVLLRVVLLGVVFLALLLLLVLVPLLARLLDLVVVLVGLLEAVLDALLRARVGAQDDLQVRRILQDHAFAAGLFRAHCARLAGNAVARGIDAERGLAVLDDLLVLV